MDIIIGGRQHGKTKRCIEIAVETGAQMVCASSRHVDAAWEMAKNMGVPVSKFKLPLTFEDVLYGRFSTQNENGFVFDDIDEMIFQYCEAIPVRAVSLTDDDMNKLTSFDDHVMVDDPVQGKKPTKEQMEKIFKWWRNVTG